MIFTLITIQDQKEFSSFRNLSIITYKMIECFMKNHVDLMMRNFEPFLIIKTIEVICLGLLVENEGKSCCCNAIKEICTTLYVYREKLSKPIQNLLKSEHTIFKEILKILLKTVIYEEHKMIWVFQKPLYPTVVINGKEDYEDIKNDIIHNEHDQSLREKIAYELEHLTMGIDFTIDKINREKFNSNFSKFKNALLKFK